MFDIDNTSLVLDLGNLIASVVLSVVGILISIFQMRNEKREKNKIAEMEQIKEESIKKLKNTVSLEADVKRIALNKCTLQTEIQSLYSSLNVVDFYNLVGSFFENGLAELSTIDRAFSSLLAEDLPKNSKYFSSLQSQFVVSLFNEYRNNCHPEIVALRDKTVSLIESLNKKIPDFQNDDISIEEKKEVFYGLLVVFEDVMKCYNTYISKCNIIIDTLYVLEKTF